MTAHLLAIELSDSLLSKVLVGIGHKGTAATLPIAVPQDVQLQDLADGAEQAEELLLTCLRSAKGVIRPVIPQPVFHARQTIACSPLYTLSPQLV